LPRIPAPGVFGTQVRGLEPGAQSQNAALALRALTHGYWGAAAKTGRWRYAPNHWLLGRVALRYPMKAGAAPMRASWGPAPRGPPRAAGRRRSRATGRRSATTAGSAAPRPRVAGRSPGSRTRR